MAARYHSVPTVRPWREAVAGARIEELDIGGVRQRQARMERSVRAG